MAIAYCTKCFRKTKTMKGNRCGNCGTYKPDKILIRIRTIRGMVKASEMRQKKYRSLINNDMIRTKRLLEELELLTASEKLGDYWLRKMNHEPIRYSDILSHRKFASKNVL